MARKKKLETVVGTALGNQDYEMVERIIGGQTVQVKMYKAAENTDSEADIKRPTRHLSSEKVRWDLDHK